MKKITITMEIEAEMCPFCGNTDLDVVPYHHENGAEDWQVLCNICMAGGPPCETDREAVKDWNKRPVQTS